VEDDAVRAGRLDRGDLIPVVTTDLVVRGIQDRADAEDDVGARERRAVRPSHAMAQMPGDREPVTRDAAVLLARHDRRELGLGPVVTVVAHEPCHRHLREIADARRREEMRVEPRHLEIHRVPQDVRRRKGVRAPRDADVHARATRRTERGAERERRGERAPREAAHQISTCIMSSNGVA